MKENGEKIHFSSIILLLLFSVDKINVGNVNTKTYQSIKTKVYFVLRNI